MSTNSDISISLPRHTNWITEPAFELVVKWDEQHGMSFTDEELEAFVSTWCLPYDFNRDVRTTHICGKERKFVKMALAIRSNFDLHHGDK